MLLRLRGRVLDRSAKALVQLNLQLLLVRLNAVNNTDTIPMADEQMVLKRAAPYHWRVAAQTEAAPAFKHIHHVTLDICRQNNYIKLGNNLAEAHVLTTSAQTER